MPDSGMNVVNKAESEAISRRNQEKFRSVRSDPGIDKMTKNLGMYHNASLVLLKNMNTSMSSMTKDIASSNKLLTNASKTSEKSKKDAKSFIREKDPNKNVVGELKDIEAALKEQTKQQRSRVISKAKGLLGVAGQLLTGLAMGGVVGYLLTGENKYLSTIRNGLGKIFGKGWDVLKDFYNSPEGKFVTGTIGKLTKDLFVGAIKYSSKGILHVTKEGFKSIFTSPEGVGQITKTFLKWGTSVMFPLTVGMPKILKNGMAALKQVGGFFKGIKNLAKFAKLSFKVLSKGGVKNLGKMLGKQTGKAIGKIGSKALGKSFLKKIPGVGSILGLIFGIGKFIKGDYIGGVLEIASGIASIFPGVGTAISFAIDAIIAIRDTKAALTMGVGDKGKAMKAVSSVPGFGSKLKNMFKNKAAADGGGDVLGSDLMVGKNTFDPSKESEIQHEDDVIYSGKDLRYGSKSSRFKSYDGVKFHPEWYTDLTNMDGTTRSNFLKMAKEYFNKTGGKYLRVNSAYRSKNPRSPHAFGRAIDIQSEDANKLEKLSLLKNFHRPLLHWGDTHGHKNAKAKNEPWHLEPWDPSYGKRDTINQDWRNKKIFVGGDSLPEPELTQNSASNLPDFEIEMNKKKSTGINLSSASIMMLAKEIGTQFQEALPTPQISNVTSVTTSARG